MERFVNKNVFLTGAASGIGKATARRLANEGAKLIIADINQEAGEKVVYDLKNLGGEAEFIKTDVSNSDSMKNLFEPCFEDDQSTQVSSHHLLLSRSKLSCSSMPIPEQGAKVLTRRRL